jgi:hypothetical protein
VAAAPLLRSLHDAGKLLALRFTEPELFQLRTEIPVPAILRVEPGDEALRFAISALQVEQLSSYVLDLLSNPRLAQK